jgi:branched-chain amino acid transport system permease protein
MSPRAHVARVPSSLPTGMGQTLVLRRGRAQWLTVVLGAIALLALPRILPVFWVHLVNGCLIAVMGAVALNVLTGNARLVSLGQAAFLGIGAFAAGLLQRAYNVPFPRWSD